MNMDTVDQARQIAAELESKLAAVSQKVMDLATSRRRLAYDASTGDAKAHKELAKLTAESAVVSIEHENATIAVHEARHRLASAEHTADQARRKAEAERLSGEVHALAEKVEARGAAISKALDSFCEQYSGLEADLTALRQLGASIAPARTVGLSFETVVAHTCRSIGLAIGDLVEPARRHSPEFLATSLATRARTWADGVLGEKAEA
jgi:chromosome segregation ATPase